MTRATITGAVLVSALVVLAVVTGFRMLDRRDDSTATSSPVMVTETAPSSTPTRPSGNEQGGFLHGRVTTDDGSVYVGRLRWGGDEEAFWSDSFNGAKNDNPWAAHAAEELLNERRPVAFFGLEITEREHRVDLDRPFAGRFGDIARIDVHGREIRVTLKSGSVFGLDRFDADDLADGVRVWDDRHGIVDFVEQRIRSIEFVAVDRSDDVPYRLHGTVRTRQGEFTGFVQWDRMRGVGTDELAGRSSEGELRVRLDTVRSIERRSRNRATVTLLDGREIVFSDDHEFGSGNRGLFVDDERYGRVLIAWEAFERVDLGPGGSGPAYADFPAGQPLAGRVTTHNGRSVTGRLVYDLDESETTETLDAPDRGVHYAIPFGLIASIVPPDPDEGGAGRARVILHSGEELRLEPDGDLAENNGGMLIFVEGGERPESVPWADVARVDLERPRAMYPPFDEQ